MFTAAIARMISADAAFRTTPGGGNESDVIDASVAMIAIRIGISRVAQGKLADTAMDHGVNRLIAVDTELRDSELTLDPGSCDLPDDLRWDSATDQPLGMTECDWLVRELLHDLAKLDTIATLCPGRTSASLAIAIPMLTGTRDLRDEDRRTRANRNGHRAIEADVAHPITSV
jgi:hypothetical protein